MCAPASPSSPRSRRSSPRPSLVGPRLNAARKTNDLPDRNTEYFLYQTLIGAWPIYAERTKTYMQKAMREAKQQTSWVANNKDYEDALNNFIDAFLRTRRSLQSWNRSSHRIRHAGRINSLTQTLLKQTSPGVPDLYQGSELWDLSLVDPDNRRPVDYELRRKLLAELQTHGPAEILRAWTRACPSYTVQQALLLRREHPRSGSAGGRIPSTRCHRARWPTRDRLPARRSRHHRRSAPHAHPGGDWESHHPSFPPAPGATAFSGDIVTGGRRITRTAASGLSRSPPHREDP